ncbi:MAG: AbfB domain-containing protein [Nannocystaceae bacterium]
MMGLFKKLKSPFVKAANAVADAVVDTSNTIVDGAKSAANGIADTTISVVNETEGVAKAVGGALVDAADVVGTSVVTFGNEVECFSVAAGGTVVDWTRTSIQEVTALSEELASNVRTFSPILYEGLKVGVAQGIQTLKEVGEMIAELFGSELPALQGPNSDAKLVAQLIFSYVFTELMEAGCRRNGTTIGWGIKFEGGIGLGGSVLIGLYCDSGGQWGFYEGTNGLPAAVEAEFTNGLTITVESIVVFGSRDDFSGARVLDPGVEVQVGPYVAGASILLKRNFRFLGFKTIFGAGVSPKKKSDPAAIEAAKQSPAARKAHLAEYAFTFSADAGGVLELLSGSSDVVDQGAAAELAVDAALDPDKAEERLRLATAASFPPFAPAFIGTISAPQYPNHRLAYNGSHRLKLEPQGTSPAKLRIRASTGDPNLICIDCLVDQGGHISAASEGKVLHGPFPDEDGAVFRMVKGLRDGGGGVSFESVKLPGRYLRYYYFDLVLHPYNDHPTFREEATFTLVPDPGPHEASLLPVIRAGEVVAPSTGPVRMSANVRAVLSFYQNGQLAVDGWWSPTPPAGSGAFTLQMGDDGRLKVYRGDTQVWATEVYGQPGPCFAAVTNESVLAIFRGTPEDPKSMVWSSKTGAVNWWTARRSVAIRAQNGQYFRADGGNALRADADGIGATEIFTLFTLHDGRVALRGSNGQYVCAEDGGGHNVVVNRDAIGPWECFTLVEDEGWVSLRDCKGYYVCAENNGGSDVNSNRNAIGPWEKFVFVDADARCGWEPLGGVLVSSPAVSHRGNGVDQPGEGEVEVLARGPESKLISRRHTPDGGWSEWTSGYGDTQSNPAIGQSGPKTLRALLGYDRACWINMGSHGQVGGVWDWHGGIWKYGPAITSWGPERFDLWTVGDDDNLQQRVYSNGTWGNWYNHGGNLTSAPSGASMSPGHHTICARESDKSIVYKTFSGGWTGWTSLGGTFTSAPSLVARGSSGMDLFARGGDMALWRRRYRDGNWQVSWERLGGNLGSAPAAVVMHDRVDVYARSADGGLMRLKLDVQWYNHGSNFSALVGGGDHLYAIQASTGDLVRVNGGSGSVTKIGDPGHHFVAGAGWIAGIRPDQSAIYRHDGQQWTKIGGPATRLIASRDELYAVVPGGDIHRYEGHGEVWTKIGDPGHAFVAGDGFVAGITPDKSAVYRWNGETWTWIAGASEGLVAAGEDLYRISPNGDIYRYGGHDDLWIRAGGPGHAFAGAPGVLTGITPDRSHVAHRRLHTPWEVPAGSPTNLKALTVVGSRLYALTDGGAIFGREI